MSSRLYLKEYKLSFMYKQLSKRIAHIMSERSIRFNTEVAKVAGVKPMTVTYWLDGTTKDIKAKHAIPIAKKWNYNAEWLITGDGPIQPGVTEPGARYSSMRLLPYDEDEILDPEQFTRLRVVDAELSAGNGCSNQIEYEDRPLAFKRITLQSAGVKEENAVIVRIIGNSMEPVLCSGDTVGINVGDTVPGKDGDAYSFRDIDMVRVKLIYRLPGGGLRLRSFNRDEYPDEDLTPEKVQERITFIGRVFWSSKLW